MLAPFLPPFKSETSTGGQTEKVFKRTLYEIDPDIQVPLPVKRLKISPLGISSSVQEDLLHCSQFQLHELIPDKSSSLGKVTVPSSKASFSKIYSNQKEYLVPTFITIQGKTFTVVDNLQEGSGSVVSFYSDRSQKKFIALKTSKFYKRQYEYIKRLSRAETVGVNSRWRDEWNLHNLLRSKFKNNSHSPVVRIFGGVAYEVGGTVQVSLAMQKIDTTLEQLIQSNKLKLIHLLNTAKSLHRLHDAGIVYADLKPSNVLIDLASNNAFFADFDCSGVACKPSSCQGGSNRYLSPSRLKGSCCDISDDLWALGVVVLEALTELKPAGVIEMATNDRLEEYISLSTGETVQTFSDDEVDVLGELATNLLDIDSNTRAELVDVELILTTLSAN